jgi:Uma2 family endonuclease
MERGDKIVVMEWYDDAMAAAHQLFEIRREEVETLMLRLPGPPRKDADWFFDFCQANDWWRFERTSQGDILVMAPAGGESGYREVRALTQLDIWADADGTGRAFSSSTGFTLPNGATRAPDAAWVKTSRLAKLAPKQKKKFIPLCPDFVIEVRSPSDRLARLQEKMEEYRENGAALGWLIDPQARKVHVYRPGQRVEVLDHPKRLSGDPELQGFVLELARIWRPDI